MDCVNCFKNIYFEGPLQVAVNNTIICFDKINHLLKKDQKDNSWSICQLSCCYTIKYTQTNLIYQGLRDFIKFQIFGDWIINSAYIYAPKHQTKH